VSLLTGSGSGSAVACIASSPTATSTSPVASRGLTASGARATTWPVTVITLSRRIASAVLSSGLAPSTTHWITP
jgi:hypothetical protein